MEKEKQTKKDKKVTKTMQYQSTETQELKSFFLVVLVVLVCVGVIYLITRAFVTKDLFQETETKEENVQGAVNYDVAIIGQILNMPESEYYVVVYDAEEGDYISDMSTLVYNYKTQEKHLHVYTVNLANPLNKGYYHPAAVNERAKSVAELSVGDITLIRVKNGAITKYITDYSKMKAELGVK